MSVAPYPYSSTPVEQISTIINDLKETFRSDVTLTREWRVDQLSRLIRLVKENKDIISDAMYKDLHRSKCETSSLELSAVIADCQDAINNLDQWMAPTKVGTNIINVPGSSYIKPDPLGTVLIMAPWNYPISLLLTPLIGALAAGNTALLRLGEYAAHTSRTLTSLVHKYFDPKNVNMIEGDFPVTQETLKHKFDLIFFTGGTNLGKLVAKTAAETLTPVVLELGGKSPAIVLEDADTTVAAKRVAWGAFVNAGQTCVRPDYGLIHSSIIKPFVEKFIKQVKLYYTYGNDMAEPAIQALNISASELQQRQAAVIKLANKENPKADDLSAINHYMSESPYLARPITTAAYERIKNIIQQDRKFIKFGGNYDDATKYIQPTVIVFDSFDSFKRSACMEGEIFGPIFPMVAIDDIEEAIQFVTSGSKPLAAYAFTQNKRYIDAISTRTSSGSLVINDCVVQLSNPELPFGGVGGSGMGAYHGKFTFDAFSHRKAILHKGYWFDLDVRYPPYTTSKQIMLNAAQSDTSWFKIHWAPVLAAGCAAVYFSLPHVLPHAIKMLASLNEWAQRQ